MHILEMTSLKLKEKYRKELHCLPYTVRGACCGRDPPRSHRQETAVSGSRRPQRVAFFPPYSAYLLSLLWMEPVLVWTGSHAKTLFHQASAPRTGHRAPKKYLTPVSGSSLLSLALPGSWDNANGFELTSVGKC